MTPASGYRPIPATGTGSATAAFHHADGEMTSSATRAVVVLALANTVNAYAMVSLFPYVGMMVKDLLSLQSTNEVGERGRNQRQGALRERGARRLPVYAARWSPP